MKVLLLERVILHSNTVENNNSLAERSVLSLQSNQGTMRTEESAIQTNQETTKIDKVIHLIYEEKLFLFFCVISFKRYFSQNRYCFLETCTIQHYHLKCNGANDHGYVWWQLQFCLSLVTNDLLWEASDATKRCCNTKRTTLQTLEM